MSTERLHKPKNKKASYEQLATNILYLLIKYWLRLVDDFRTFRIPRPDQVFFEFMAA